MADLAVLGPIVTLISPSALADGESLPIGSDVYLIGYPGEVEPLPQPTIVRGLLSRRREQEYTGITYFQTDAPVIGGQSGGVLVSALGEVIGISGFRFTDANFGIVGSWADILPRVTSLILLMDDSGLGDRTIPRSGGKFSHEIVMGNYWSELAFVIDEPPGTAVGIELDGSNNGAITVYDSAGNELLSKDEAITGAEGGSFSIEYDEPHFLVAWQLAEVPGDFTLSGTHRLIPLHDPDDGRQIQVGESLSGNIDFPGDVDHFILHLRAEERVQISTQSILADTFLTVDYLGATDEQIIVDNDAGGGLFGVDARIVYRAPHTGTYFLVVGDINLDAPGGYVITVVPADPRAPLTHTTRIIGDPLPVHTPGPTSDFGIAELRSAFAELPESYEEVDPSDLYLSIEAIGLGDFFDSFALFSNAEQVEFLMAASGSGIDGEAFDSEVSDEGLLDSVIQGFMIGAGEQEGIEFHESRLLNLPIVGDSSFGATTVFATEGIRLRAEFLMFRREDLVGAVYLYTIPDAVPAISIESAARMLDAKMADVIASR